MPSDKQISWEVRTHEHREHSTDWYWTLGAFAVVGAGLSLWFGNALLSIILILGCGSIAYLTARGPREHIVHIDNRGITIDGTLYTYASLRSFWVEQDSEKPRLFLSTSGILNPRLTMPLDSKAQGQEVRAHLREYIAEEEQEPHAGEHLAEIFGL